MNELMSGKAPVGTPFTLADPDGNEFEIMWRVPADAWGDYKEHAVVKPLDLAAELAQWGNGSAVDAG